MIRLGRMYFWKFLDSCDINRLDEFTENLRLALSEAAARSYLIEETDSSTRETISRWSRGYFNAQELRLKFLRFTVVYRPDSDNEERWRTTVSFTRIPHIAGAYSNSQNAHTLDPSIQRSLSERLIELRLADVFARGQERPNVGTSAGLYLYLKMQRLAALKNLAEDSKYTPQGSDLKELFQKVSALFAEGNPVPEPIELSTRGRVRDFLEKCDRCLTDSLGDEKLEALLRSTGVSAKQWLNAGRQNLLERLWSGGGSGGATGHRRDVICYFDL